MSNQFSFADMKKTSATSKDKLIGELTKLNDKGGGREADQRFWQPTVDKAGNGYAVIRFLPAPPGEDVPFVRLWDHGFKGPTGKWYIENSRTTIGEDDPVSDFNSKLWNASQDDDSPERKQARNQKRRLFFLANILVVSDTANPANEGKVFLFKFGKKIFDKVNDMMNPQFPDDVPVNVFDFWEGANFKLKIRNVEGYRNYDKSEFDKPSVLSKDDSELERIWREQHSLKEFLDPKNFKSYDELQKKLNQVLGLDGDPAAARATAAARKSAAADELEEVLPKSFRTAEASTSPSSDTEDEEAVDFFKRLAADD